MSILDQRLAAVRDQFSDWDVDALLITTSTNRHWLSGFSGSAGTLLITREQALLATDSRYYERATAEAPAFTLFKHRRTKEDTAEMLKRANVSRIGVEASGMTLAEFTQFRQFDEIKWKPLDTTIEALRQIKSAEEIEAIRRAAAITDEAMALVNTLARPGVTERALAWELERAMRENGADAMAFPIIVASGPNSALPHHTPSDRELQAGDALTVDMGAKRDGYCSDMTRSFYLGNEPSDTFWEVYNLVLKAETAVIEQLHAGMDSAETDAIARNIISEAGHGDHFGHGLGHGVGMDIHEKPLLSPRAKDTPIAENMVVTVEPGVYLPGWGGVRIEDLVRVTPNAVDLLSFCPKIPIIPLS